MEVDIDISNLNIKDNKRCHHDCESPENKKQEAEHLRRSGRKKNKTVRSVENFDKRRVLTRPRKLNLNSTIKEVENYYLDKKIKISSPALETIFEEPKKEIFMSLRRVRRFINFSDIPNEKADKNKVKKRSMKAKKISKFKSFGKKVGLELLMNKLKDLDNEES